MDRNQSENWLLSVTVIAFALILLFHGSAFGQSARDNVEKVPHQFLVRYCLQCHCEDQPEADFRLDEFHGSFSSLLDVAIWTKVLKKLEEGEMPPSEAPQPSRGETDQFTSWVTDGLVHGSQCVQNSEGRVVLRRLNRAEYENTIRDLFAIDIDLKESLPEDNSALGFDNIGAALSVSSVLLERYLEAADSALDMAIQTGERPTRTKGRYSYKDERRVKDHKSYLPVDDGLVFFSAGYSPTEINQFRAPRSGKYRIGISAYAHQSDRPVIYRVYGRDDVRSHLAGYFSAGLTPTVSEFETQLGKGKTIRVVPYGTWLKKWAEAASETGPGLAVQWVEIEGPLIEDWPPESHQRIFGDLPIEVVNADEIKRNRRIKPLREVVANDPVEDARRILQRVLPQFFRRPVEQATIEEYLRIIKTQLDEGSSFQSGVRVGLKAALCSPDFLYLKERRGQPLDDYQLASRLSYFLWSTMPDEALLSAAASGKLIGAEELRQQTERMLNDQRASRFTENFVGQWLDLRNIELTSPDAKLYPEFDELLQISMVKETYLFFEEILRRDLSVLNFVDSDFSFLNQRLAKHYGIDGTEGLNFRKVQLPAGSHRGGVLTHGSVLKVTANGTNTSPVLRGVWLLDKILGDPVGRPPANVPAVEPDIRGATSIREQFSKHRQTATCASCHKKIDPAGFALENFDVIGGWRDNYRSIGEGDRVHDSVLGRSVRYKRGLPVDAGDTLATGEEFQTIEQFKAILLKDPEPIVRGLTEKLITYATGAGIQFADRAEISEIVQQLKSRDYGLRSMVHQVVQSQVFRNK